MMQFLRTADYLLLLLLLLFIIIIVAKINVTLSHKNVAEALQINGETMDIW